MMRKLSFDISDVVIILDVEMIYCILLFIYNKRNLGYVVLMKKKNEEFKLIQ
jgi:hypothetical protein